MIKVADRSCSLVHIPSAQVVPQSLACHKYKEFMRKTIKVSQQQHCFENSPPAEQIQDGPFNGVQDFEVSG